MSTDPQPVAMMIPAAAPSRTRHAFGWPPGSVRALLTLMIVGLVCALMLMSTAEKPLAIPPYLLYLLFLVLGHYFAARGANQRNTGEGQPLHLPRGSVRLILLAALVATVAYQLTQHAAVFENTMKASVDELERHPQLPLFVLGGFFLGVLLRMFIIGPNPSPWWQDVEAWVCLIATFGMGVSVLIHLIIVPSVTERFDMPVWEASLGAIVAFYFGARS